MFPHQILTLYLGKLELKFKTVLLHNKSLLFLCAYSKMTLFALVHKKKVSRDLTENFNGAKLCFWRILHI